MHETIVKGILSSTHGMNLYRGCTHGCIYCDARSRCYQMNHDFEDIEVKKNAIELLENTLRRKKQRFMIGTGAMCDPYIPIEEQLQYTKKSLELIKAYGFGVSILTKSNRILRDLDILKKINEKTKCVVQMTLTTYDENLCKILEPNVSTTKERVEVLKIMRDEGIKTIVWLCPILPFINDTVENIEGILSYCIEANVHGILAFSIGMTLREGNREYFYEKLDQHFPGMKKRYIETYGNSYELLSPNHKELMKILKKACDAHQMLFGAQACFSYLHEFKEKGGYEQIVLDV
ncbi:radical SAM protein [Lachnospiraceae bacterium ZAX-1]